MLTKPIWFPGLVKGQVKGVWLSPHLACRGNTSLVRKPHWIQPPIPVCTYGLWAELLTDKPTLFKGFFLTVPNGSEITDMLSTNTKVGINLAKLRKLSCAPPWLPHCAQTASKHRAETKRRHCFVTTTGGLGRCQTRSVTRQSHRLCIVNKVKDRWDYSLWSACLR